MVINHGTQANKSSKVVNRAFNLSLFAITEGLTASGALPRLTLNRQAKL